MHAQSTAPRSTFNTDERDRLDTIAVTLADLTNQVAHLAHGGEHADLYAEAIRDGIEEAHAELASLSLAA